MREICLEGLGLWEKAREEMAGRGFEVRGRHGREYGRFQDSIFKERKRSRASRALAPPCYAGDGGRLVVLRNTPPDRVKF